MMEDTLVEMMSHFVELSEGEKQGIREAFPIQTFPKGHNLLREGAINKDAFVVIQGCIRKYYLEDGEEVSSGFYTELQSASNRDSMVNRTPSKYYLTCSEDTVVAVMNSEKEEALYKKFPRFAEVCRMEMEKMLGTTEEEFLTFRNAAPKERYLNLLRERPELVNRVPQYQLASYLGMKPETLSRIRKRLASSGS